MWSKRRSQSSDSSTSEPGSNAAGTKCTASAPRRVTRSTGTSPMRPRSSGCGHGTSVPPAPARPGPCPAQPRPYLPAALGEEDGVLQHHLEPAHRLPAALGPQLRRPARHHPGGELRQRRWRREGSPGPAPRPSPGPTLPAGPSCPAGTGTPSRPLGTSEPGLAARAAAEGPQVAVAAVSGRSLHGDARARSRRRRALPGPVRVSGSRCPARRRRPQRTAHGCGSSRLLPRAPRV